MTGQARILIHAGGTRITLQCQPCKLDKPYPTHRAARDDAKLHNAQLHGNGAA